MAAFEQGDLLKVSGISFPVIVVSNDLFNSTGKAVVCPIEKNIAAGPLLLPQKKHLGSIGEFSGI